MCAAFEDTKSAGRVANRATRSSCPHSSLPLVLPPPAQVPSPLESVVLPARDSGRPADLIGQCLARSHVAEPVEAYQLILENAEGATPVAEIDSMVSVARKTTALHGRVRTAARHADHAVTPAFAAHPGHLSPFYCSACPTAQPGPPLHVSTAPSPASAPFHYFVPFAFISYVLLDVVS